MSIEQPKGKTISKIAIHQPNFLPWIGYFYKITKADCFVFLDNVQYTKNSFINRNKIKTSQGVMWLTVPVSFNFGQLIKDVTISNEVDWRIKHLKTFEMNYAKAACFKEVFNLITNIYMSKNWEYLCEFNISLIKFILSYLDLGSLFVKASDLNVQGKSTELLIQIVKILKGNIYLSGFGGAQYQEEKLFKKEEISLEYYNFIHPKYSQLWGEFMPNLSIIDLLFNCGKESKDIIFQIK